MNQGYHGSHPELAERIVKMQEREAKRIEEAKARFYIGLDLGQAQDFTALCVIQRELVGAKQDPYCTIPRLKRWPLGTSYPDIVDEVAGRMARSPDNTRLIIDGTGCGRAVTDMFLKHPALAARRSFIHPITITGGDHETYLDGYHRIPKRNLVGATQVLLQDKRLKIASTLPETQILVTELQNFRVKITATAHDSYEAWREGAHDDLVLACALGCWGATSRSLNQEFEQWKFHR